MGILDVFRDAAYNRKLYKEGKANKGEVRLTIIGWRPDPVDEQDGFTEDCQGCDTPSGNAEYYRVIRSSKKRK